MYITKPSKVVRMNGDPISMSAPLVLELLDNCVAQYCDHSITETQQNVHHTKYTGYS